MVGTGKRSSLFLGKRSADLKSDYWQLKIRLEDKEKTAFSVGNGL